MGVSIRGYRCRSPMISSFRWLIIISMMAYGLRLGPISTELKNEM